MTFAEHFAKMWWAYVVIFVMVCLSAFFSASEIAFNTSNKMRLRRAAEWKCGGENRVSNRRKVHHSPVCHSHRKQPCEHRRFHLHHADCHEPVQG